MAGSRTSRTHNAVWIWDLKSEVTRKPSFSLEYESADTAASQSKTGAWIAICSDSRRVAVGCEDQNIRIWDLTGDLSEDLGFELQPGAILKPKVGGESKGKSKTANSLSAWMASPLSSDS